MHSESRLEFNQEWQKSWAGLPAFAQLALRKIMLVFGGQAFEWQQLSTGIWPAAVYRAGAIQLAEIGILQVKRQEWGGIVLQLTQVQWPAWQEILWGDEEQPSDESHALSSPYLSRLGHALLTLMYVTAQHGSRLTKDGRLEANSSRRWVSRFNKDTRYSQQLDPELALETLALAKRWNLLSEEADRSLLVNDRVFDEWIKGRSVEFERMLYDHWSKEQLERSPPIYHLVRWCERHASRFHEGMLYDWIAQHAAEMGPAHLMLYEQFKQQILQTWHRYGWLVEQEDQEAPLGKAWHLSPLLKFEAESVEAGAYVLADFEIIVPPDQPLWVYARLERFCKLKSQEEVTLYQLDIFRHKPESGDAQALLSFLRTLSLHPLPDTVVRMIESWGGKMQDLPVEPVQVDIETLKDGSLLSNRMVSNPQMETVRNLSTELTWDVIYPAVHQLPRQWLQEHRIYHRSTASDLFRTAVDMQCFIQLDDSERGRRWVIPERWDEADEQLIARTEAGVPMILHASEQRALKLRLPGVNLHELPSGKYW